VARALFGADPLDAGRVWIHGREVRVRSPQHAIRLGLGFLPEDRKRQGLVLGLGVAENMCLASLDRFSRGGVVHSGRVNAAADQLVTDLRVKTPGITQRVLQLSGGNQQKVVLAKWLCRDADILIFDEPTRGIDVGAKVEIYQLINRLVAAGKAILLISSDLPEVLGMSDRVLVMHRGRITGEFTAADARPEAVLQCALGAQAA
jgi:ribose transport system ATP-binding protein